MKHKQFFFLVKIQFLNSLHKNTLCSCFMNKSQCIYTRIPFLFFSTCCRGHKIRMKMSLWRPVNFGSHSPSSLCVRRFCVDTCPSEYMYTHSILLIKNPPSTHVHAFYFSTVQQLDKASYLM